MMVERQSLAWFVIVVRVPWGCFGRLGKIGGVPPPPLPLHKVSGFIELLVELVCKIVITKALWVYSPLSISYPRRGGGAFLFSYLLVNSTGLDETKMPLGSHVVCCSWAVLGLDKR